VSFWDKVRLHIHPGVHPEDAWKAVRTWYRRTESARKNPTPNVILESFFIATLANFRPWSDEQIRQLEKSSKSRAFCEPSTEQTI